MGSREIDEAWIRKSNGAGAHRKRPAGLEVKRAKAEKP
jgi:hypothetical protein